MKRILCQSDSRSLVIKSLKSQGLLSGNELAGELDGGIDMWILQITLTGSCKREKKRVTAGRASHAH